MTEADGFEALEDANVVLMGFGGDRHVAQQVAMEVDVGFAAAPGI